MDADLRPSRSEASLGDLVRDAAQQTSTLVRDEVQLAKVELRHDIKQAVAGLKLFTVAGVAGLLAALMLSAAAGFGIGRVLGEGWAWAGFLIVGVVYLLTAGIAALSGKRKAEEIPPPAPRTTEQLKRTAAAAKEIKV